MASEGGGKGAADTLRRWTSNGLYFVQGFAKKAAKASKEVVEEIREREGKKPAGTDRMKPPDLFETKPHAGNGPSASAAWKSFTEGLGGAGAKIPGYSFALLKNAASSVAGVVLPGWTLRRIGWVAGFGFVVGFFVGKKFGGVHVHLTTPALPPGYNVPATATQLASSVPATATAVAVTPATPASS